MPRNPELEAAILADPDDPQVYLVYADWLQQQGDPRGELITLMAQAEQQPSLRPAVAAYLDRHEATLLGTVEHLKETLDGRFEPAFTWRRGFIDKIRLAYNKYVHEKMRATVGKGWEPGELMTRMLSHPSSRFVTRVEVGLILGANGRDYQTVVDSLALEERPTISSLHIGDFEFPDESELSWTNLGYMGHMWSKLPGLRELIVQGGRFELGEIVLLQLREATFRTCGLSLESVEALGAAEWPRLERLEIWFGDEARGARGGVVELAPLLAGVGLPNLRHLALRNASFTNELAEVLPDAPILRQLESLDLSMGTLDDVGAAHLVRRRQAFEHLALLDVSDSYLGADALESLTGVAHTVVASDQQEGEPRVSVGE